MRHRPAAVPAALSKKTCTSGCAANRPTAAPCCRFRVPWGWRSAGLLSWSSLILIIVGFTLAGLGGGMLVGYISTAEAVVTEQIKNKNETTTITDSEGNDIAILTGSQNINREYISISTVKSTYIDEAFMAIEDERFDRAYRHRSQAHRQRHPQRPDQRRLGHARRLDDHPADCQAGLRRGPASRPSARSRNGTRRSASSSRRAKTRSWSCTSTWCRWATAMSASSRPPRLILTRTPPISTWSNAPSWPASPTGPRPTIR